MSAPLRAAVFGASGGLGAALVAQLGKDPRFGEVIACSRRGAGHLHFDLTDEASIRDCLAAIGLGGSLDLVLVATGLLHQESVVAPEKSIRQLDPEAMARVLAINAIGPALIAKHAAPLLARNRRVVFAALSARVGSITDNRLGGWHSYRAGKAALNMLLRNLAIELARTHPLSVVAALHPGTVDSALSAPFQRGLKPGQLFSPEQAAAHLLCVIDRLSPQDSGHAWDWQGEQLPF